MMKLSVLCRSGLWVLMSVLVLAAGCDESKKESAGPKVEPEQKVVEPAPEPVAPVEPEPPVVVIPAEPEPAPVPEPNQPPVVAEPPKVVEPNEPAEPVVAQPEPNQPAEPVADANQVPAEPKAGAVELALKFKAGDTGAYKVTVEADKSVEWEGAAGSKPQAFTGGHTGNVMEVTFTQTIKSVDEQGNAIAEITIKALKYQQKVKDSLTSDFDSANEADRAKPLGKILNQSYTILLSPKGQLLRVMDAAKARQAAPDATAQALLSDSAIQERHSIAALDTGETKSFGAGDKYSNIRSLNFGMMGAKAYERVYTVKDVQESGDAKVAQVDMEAVPSTQGAEQNYAQQGNAFFAKMFDNTENYSGTMKFDVNTGTVKEYSETLKSEWFAVDPAAAPNTQPDALKMTATRSYKIVKLD